MVLLSWLVVVKTPIPILLAVIVGSALLLRNRRTLASCFFLSFGVVQFVGLSLSGAKWIRYSLPILPFYLPGRRVCGATELERPRKEKPGHRPSWERPPSFCLDGRSLSCKLGHRTIRST